MSGNENVAVEMTPAVRAKAIDDLKKGIGDTAEAIVKLRFMLQDTERIHENFKRMLTSLIVNAHEMERSK